MILKEEFILCNSYNKEFCDYSYDSSNCEVTPPEGIIHVTLDDVRDFFARHGNNGINYILVSSSSDFGLHYQNESLYWNDYAKHIKFQNLAQIHQVGIQNVDNPATPHGYFGCNLPVPCQVENCDIRHRYAIKTDRWTWGTFHEIPPNIKYWFMTNLSIKDERCEAIPFGIFSAPEVADTIEKVNSLNIKADKLLYVNFSNYTIERVDIKNWFRAIDMPGVTIYDKADLTLEKHLTNIASHKFTLCPEGNGLQSYRTLETIYLNRIPIIKHSFAANTYSELPVIYVDDYKQITRTLLNITYCDFKKQTNFTSAYKSYWKGKFEHARQLHL